MYPTNLDVQLFELRDPAADPRDASDDLVPRHTGENRVMPFIADLMEIRVTDPAVENLDDDIFSERLAAA